MPKHRYARGKLQGRSDWWHPVGWLQFGFLYDAGLKPSHRLLDVGCGTFRVGRMLIDYLEPGRYYGVDQHQAALDVGTKRVLEPNGLLDKEPQLFVHKLCKDASEFDVMGFDYIWVHSVFIHTGPIVACCAIRDLSRVLSVGGHIFATAFINPDPENTEPIRWNNEPPHIITYSDREFWHYTEEFFLDVAAEVSLTVDIQDYAHPYPMKMLEMRNA